MTTSLSITYDYKLLLLLIMVSIASADFTCSSAGQECADDCNSLLTCTTKGAAPVLVRACASPTPYCVSGRCVEVPGTGCTAAAASFSCTGAGLFPDPADCALFHICDDNLSASSLSCPTGFVYYSRGQLCRKRLNNNCQTLRGCQRSGNAGKLVRFDDDPAIFAYCSANGAPTMYRCTDEQNEIFDERQGACRYDCRRDGQFVDRSNCNGYVLCRKLNNEWRPQAFDCPTDYWFNQTRCVKQGSTKCVSEIQTQTTSSTTAK